MSDMVERVARAICEGLGENPDAPHMTLGEKELRAWQQHEGLARAAIDAHWQALLLDRASIEAMAVKLSDLCGDENYWDLGLMMRAERMNECQHLLRTAALVNHLKAQDGTP